MYFTSFDGETNENFDFRNKCYNRQVFIITAITFNSIQNYIIVTTLFSILDYGYPPRGQNWGPETRIFKLICNKNPKINVFLKFEGPISKIENFKILAIFENFLGPKSKFRS